MKKEVILLRKKREENFAARGVRILPRVLATGALVAMLTAMTPAPVLNNSPSVASNITERERSVKAVEEVNYVNNYSHTAGVVTDGNRIIYSLPGVSDKNLWKYTLYNVRVGGVRLSDYGTRINGVTYLPLRAYFAAIGATVSYNSKTRTMTVGMPGLNLTATDGGYVIYANDRPIFNFSPNVIMSNGRMYVSMASLMKITGQKAEVSGDTVSISGKVTPLAPAKSYYREDEVFWLARIITAEAGGESLIGQIAVGNVIMNRVSSRLYPNTIYGVIFDRKYGVQFSPVLDGRIYNTPTYNATLAAKICLEGVRLSEDAMFFLNPRTAESSWIVNSREYAYTIGGHDFYK